MEANSEAPGEAADNEGSQIGGDTESGSGIGIKRDNDEGN